MVLSLQNPAKLPHEYRSGQAREPIPGREDNIPRAMPPIVEHLAPRHRAMGRIGRFSSRNPLLGITADQEGSIPMPMKSTQAMFPGPMPPGLYNHTRDSIENADYKLIESPMLTQTADHVELHRRVHQDRGNYHHPVNATEIGETEVTHKPVPTNIPFRPVPTNRSAIENRIGFSEAINQANVAHGGRESITRTRKGGEFVNNRGSVALKTLVEHGLGIETDPRQSLKFEFDVSGAPSAMNQANVVIDPRTFRNRDTKKVFRAEVSGAPSTVHTGPLRRDEGFFEDNRPTNSTIDTHVSFGPDLYLDFAADRFQKRRTHMFDHRPEQKSSLSDVWEGHAPPRTLFDRPIVAEGRVSRVTDRDGLSNTGRIDSGNLADAQRSNPLYHDAHHFYAKLQTTTV